ncbi:MAG: AAA family ATPase [Actinomycetota bacterium]|nr:AAA family ATPase [Actinomycetota bacterium]
MNRRMKPRNKKGREYRRSISVWDRIKILLFLAGLFLFIAWYRTSTDPFSTFPEMLRELAVDTTGTVLFVLMGLEVVRQVHYLISEHWSRYHRFWKQRVFGGTERTLDKVPSWTRFRVARVVRWAVIISAYAWLVTLLVDGIDGPAEAIAQTPRLFLGILPMLLYLIFIISAVVLQFVAIFWFLSKGGVDVHYPEDIETGFEQVWGQDHVLELVKESIAFLDKPDEIEDRGGYLPGGLLLWGPPGTGKTLMAEAMAGETGKPFVFVDPGSFINMFMGVGILKVKSLFRKLRKLSLKFGGVIVFFDEADSLGSRGALAGQGPWQPSLGTALFSCNGWNYLSDPTHQALQQASRLPLAEESDPAPKRRLLDRIFVGAGMGGGGMGTLQALLSEISGLTKPRGLGNRIRRMLGMKPKAPPKYRILIVMATNMPEALDEALLRPGRIDRIYKVPYPSKDGRVRTLEGYLAKVPNDLAPEQVDRLAVMTPYFSGAKIKDLVNEALILAIRDGREVVTWDDLWRAKALKELGPPENVQYVERERHAVAVHEACHAVTAHLLRTHMAIDVVTIEKHSQALGMVKNLPVEDRYTQWKTEYETDIKVSLASLVGERMFFAGDSSSGVSGDLQSATQLTALMEGAWGMGEGITSLFLASRHLLGPGADPTQTVLTQMNERVEKRLARLYREVEELLEAHKDQVLRLADVLEERKTISGDEVAQILDVPAGLYASGHNGNGGQLPLEVAIGDGQGAEPGSQDRT